MTQTLYIDGQLADIDDRLNVAMNIKSNLLGDISRMAANHTYTLQLPCTAHNRTLIANSDTLAVTTSFPYQYHKADYYRNGTPIIQNGVAVLLSVTDTIEICLTWGVSTPLSQFIASGATLRDLIGNEVIAYPTHPVVTKWGVFIADGTYAPFYADADYHKPLESDEQENHARSMGWNASYNRPVVRVPWLLQKISSTFGVFFNWAQVAQDLFDVLCIPLISDKPNDLTLTTSTITLGAGTRTGSRTFLYAISVGSGSNVFSSWDTNNAYVGTSKTITLTFDITLNNIDAATATGIAAETYMQVRINDSGNYSEPEELQMPFQVVSTSGNVSTLQCKGTLDVVLGNGQGIAIEWNSRNMFYSLNSIAAMLTGNVINANDQTDHVQFGGNYPIISNLPDIKILDFLKTLCALCGVFPKQPKGDTITFVPFDVLESNKDYPVDWTDKVIPSYELERPKTTQYRVSEWAQKNWFRWKEDDTYAGQYDKPIEIADKTLDAERDLFTLPFAPSMCSQIGRALIPIWELNNYLELQTETPTPTPSYNIETCEPRLLVAVPKNSRRYVTGGDDSNKDVMLTMQGLTFGEIVANKYNTLAMMLNNARVVTERMRLNDGDLLQFDETTPVYLGQYGHYFAVLEINADSDGTAEVQMIKL